MEIPRPPRPPSFPLLVQDPFGWWNWYSAKPWYPAPYPRPPLPPPPCFFFPAPDRFGQWHTYYAIPFSTNHPPPPPPPPYGPPYPSDADGFVDTPPEPGDESFSQESWTQFKKRVLEKFKAEEGRNNWDKWAEQERKYWNKWAQWQWNKWEEWERFYGPPPPRPQENLHPPSNSPRPPGWHSNSSSEPFETKRKEALEAYDTFWAALSGSGGKITEPLTFRTVPWPQYPSPGSAKDIKANEIRNFLSSDKKGLKVYVREALLRFHSDKTARLLARVVEPDRVKVAAACEAVTRCLADLNRRTTN